MSSWIIVWILIILTSIFIAIKTSNKSKTEHLPTKTISEKLGKLFVTYFIQFLCAIVFSCIVFFSINSFVAYYIVSNKEIVNGKIIAINVGPQAKHVNNVIVKFKTIKNKEITAYLSDELKNNNVDLLKNKDNLNEFCIVITTSDNYFYKTYNYKNIIIKCKKDNQ